MVVKALIVTWDQFFNSHVVLFSVANFLAKLLLLVGALDHWNIVFPKNLKNPNNPSVLEKSESHLEPSQGHPEDLKKFPILSSHRVCADAWGPLLLWIKQTLVNNCPRLFFWIGCQSRSRISQLASELIVSHLGINSTLISDFCGTQMTLHTSNLVEFSM